jgi:prepilin-type N-terminal cleavage/methylation domain-containing protein
MPRTRQHNQTGFTLVEIMIVVAIIALLASLAVPSFLRARKRSQATVVLEELRLLEHSLDQYSIERNKKAGDNASFTDLQAYLKKGSALYGRSGRDLLGASYGSFSVDVPPTVPVSTYNTLSDVAPASFWSPYNP